MKSPHDTGTKPDETTESTAIPEAATDASRRRKRKPGREPGPHERIKLISDPVAPTPPDRKS